MFAIFLLTLGWASSLTASCCSSGSSGGIGRLLPHERALVELSQDARLVVGSFDDQGQFISGMPDHLPYWQFNHELQVMTRLSHFFLPFVKIPVRTQLSRVRTGSHLADLVLGARWPLSLYGINIVSSVQLPTGSTCNAQSSNQIESLSGLGAWLLALGVMYEHSLKAWLMGVGYNINLEPRIFKSEGFSSGPQHAPFLSLGYPIHENGFLNGTLSAMFSHRARLKDQAVADSAKQKISASLGYNLRLHSHLSLTSSLGADIALSHWAKNVNSEVFMRLGLRVGVF